jgi:hypothetical protein
MNPQRYAWAVMGLMLLAGCDKGAPSPASQQPKPSDALHKHLYEPSTHVRIAPTELSEFCRYQNQYGGFGKKGLRYIVDTDVRGKLSGDWYNEGWARILDDFCTQNGCQWSIVDANTIRIKRIAAGP